MYVDALILLNTVYNFFLLYLTGLLAARAPGLGRMIIGALLGSLCLLLLYFPQGKFLLTAGGKLLSAFGLVLLVYKPGTCKKALFLWLQFLFVSFVLGGVLFGFNSLLPLSFGRSLLYTLAAPHFIFLIAAPLVALFLLRFSLVFSKESQLSSEVQYEVVIHLGSKKINAQAFLDTGNRVREPISGLPVLLASYQAVRALFPPSWPESWEGEWGEQITKGETIIGSSSLASLFRPIPIQLVNKTENFLWGFRPSRVEIYHQGQRIRDVNQVYVGILSGPKAFFENYEVLLHQDILIQTRPFSFKEARRS